MKMFRTVPMLLGFLALPTSPTAVCQAADTALGGEPGVAWPLRASSNGRYVSDSKGVPVLLIGDSAQSLSGIYEDDGTATHGRHGYRGTDRNLRNADQ